MCKTESALSVIIGIQTHMAIIKDGEFVVMKIIQENICGLYLSYTHI